MTGIKDDDKVYLAWVHSGMVHEPFSRAMMEACLYKPNNVWGLTSASNPRQEVARNAAIRNFLTTEGDWLMWVDTDQTFLGPAIEGLVDTANTFEADIIAGIGFSYNRAAEELAPNAYMWDEPQQGYVPLYGYEKGKIYDVDAVGGGFTMIHRRVFESFEDEYWHQTWREHPHTGKMMGHDLAFCWRAKMDYNHKIMWDTRIPTGHIKAFELTEINYDASRYVIEDTENP